MAQQVGQDLVGPVLAPVLVFLVVKVALVLVDKIPVDPSSVHPQVVKPKLTAVDHHKGMVGQVGRRTTAPLPPQATGLHSVTLGLLTLPATVSKGSLASPMSRQSPSNTGPSPTQINNSTSPTSLPNLLLNTVCSTKLYLRVYLWFY